MSESALEVEDHAGAGWAIKDGADQQRPQVRGMGRALLVEQVVNVKFRVGARRRRRFTLITCSGWEESYMVERASIEMKLAELKRSREYC